MLKGYLATINYRAFIWVVIDDKDYRKVSAKVVHVLPGCEIRLGRDLVTEPLDSSPAIEQAKLEAREGKGGKSQ